MKTYTYGDLKTQVEDELDLTDETFITPTEMIAYANQALTEAEAEIHRLQIEDQYFLTSTTVTLTAGQKYIDLPTDIYANKIVDIVCLETPEAVSYKVKFLHNNNRYDKFERIANAISTDMYQAMLVNVSGVMKILVTPVARPMGATFTIWYIRSINRVVNDATVIEVPEFDIYLKSVMKGKCREKENLGAMPPDAQAEIMNSKKLMLDTLANRVSEEPNFDSQLDYYINHN